MRKHFEGERPRPLPFLTVRTYYTSKTFRWNVLDRTTPPNKNGCPILMTAILSLYHSLNKLNKPLDIIRGLL